MAIKTGLDKVLITLEVGNKTALLIALDKNGSIHRKGNGNPNAPAQILAQGISQDGHFDALMMTIDESVFNFTGVVKHEPRLGNECVLTIAFNGVRGEDYSFRVIYGDQSQGPPRELAAILINAVKLTEGWYQEELNPKEEKKWFEFWK